MIINNFEYDCKKLMEIEGENASSIANKVDMLPNNVVRTYKANRVTSNLIKIFEVLGYDIKITYVKREKTAEEILKKGTK